MCNNYISSSQKLKIFLSINAIKKLLVKNGCINLLKIKAKIKSIKNIQKKYFFKSKIEKTQILFWKKNI